MSGGGIISNIMDETETDNYYISLYLPIYSKNTDGSIVKKITYNNKKDYHLLPGCIIDVKKDSDNDINIIF